MVMTNKKKPGESATVRTVIPDNKQSKSLISARQISTIKFAGNFAKVIGKHLECQLWQN